MRREGGEVLEERGARLLDVRREVQCAAGATQALAGLDAGVHPVRLVGELLHDE